MRGRIILILFIFIKMVGCETVNQSSGKISVLVFTKTNDYYHESIPAAVEAVKNICKNNNWQFTHSEDSLYFTPDNLSRHQVIVFLNTSGEVLGEEQQQAFESYMDQGGNFVGIHGASATSYNWDWYINMIGTQFENHPHIQEAKLIVNNSHEHPAIKHLEKEWIWTDEWYNFDRPLPEDAVVLIEIDENSYEGGEMGENHPIAWYRELDNSRVFYTALGHAAEYFQDQKLLKHIEEGIRWAGSGQENLKNE